ncbi:nuclear speckle splicing regulatory protein 1-like [Paramacrobiotus metropolitanus]|uniref:nuclear speckle splicing regulatory protein 1-like n=1 Tax=Paramacrobiotus metropolitanus TaxID=2943436 RepID=UPI002445A220|nr:nuclear speckle splicing regulatory protein 1-like [Paramacrobiotus metropolitanus]
MDSSSGAGKQYGLIIPKKSTAVSRLKPSAAFLDTELDDEGPSQPKNIGEALNREKPGLRMKLATQSMLHDALTEDQDVFEYDKVYEQMQRDKAERDGTAKEKEKDRKPKYVHALLQASKEREKEYERRVERKIQKEREAEGDAFGDKEQFVTSAYKKKLQEQREAEAREKALERIEDKLDVTKQEGLGLFYKHLLKQQTGEEKVRNAGESYAEKEAVAGGSKAEKRLAEETLLEVAKRSRQGQSRGSEDTEEEVGVSSRRDRSVSPAGEVNAETGIKDQASSHGITAIKADSQSPLASLTTSVERERKAAAVIEDKKALLFSKRSTDDSTLSARERYLARQAAKQAPSSDA